MKKYSNIVTPERFILLSIGTFGIYELFWFYKVWHFLKAKEELHIRPSIRALLAPFYIWTLGKRINKLLKEEKIPYELPTFWLGVAYFAFCLLAALEDPFWVLSYLAFWPLLKFLKAMNLYWNKTEKGKLPPKPLKVWQEILLSLGVIASVVVVLAVLTEMILQVWWNSF